MERDNNKKYENKNGDNVDLFSLQKNLNIVMDNLHRLGLLNVTINPDTSSNQKMSNNSNYSIENLTGTHPIIQFHSNNTIQTTNNNIITSKENQKKNFVIENTDFLKSKKKRTKEEIPKRKALEFYKSDDSSAYESDSPSIISSNKNKIEKNNKRVTNSSEGEVSETSDKKGKEVENNKKENIKEKNIKEDNKKSYEYVQMMKYKKLQNEIKDLKKKKEEIDKFKENVIPLKKKKNEEKEEFLYIKYYENECEFIVIFLSPLVIKPGVINIMYFIRIEEYFKSFDDEQLTNFFSDVSLKLNIKPKDNINDNIIQKLKKDRQVAVCQINSNIHLIVHFSAFPNLLRTDLVLKEIKDKNLLNLLNISNSNNINNTIAAKDILMKESKEYSKNRFITEKEFSQKDKDNKEKIIADLKNEIDNYKRKLDKITHEFEDVKRNNSLLEDKLSNNITHFNMIQKQYKEKNENIIQEKNNIEAEIKILKEEIIILKNKCKEEKSINDKNKMIIFNTECENEKLIEDLKKLNLENETLKDEVKKLHSSRIKIDDFLIEEVKNGPKVTVPTSDANEEKGVDVKSACILCCENKRDILFSDCSHSYCCSYCLKNSYLCKVKNVKVLENKFTIKNGGISCAICKTNNNTFLKIIYA